MSYRGTFDVTGRHIKSTIVFDVQVFNHGSNSPADHYSGISKKDLL